jgi:hypothetical protein
MCSLCVCVCVCLYSNCCACRNCQTLPMDAPKWVEPFLHPSNALLHAAQKHNVTILFLSPDADEQPFRFP